MKEELWFGIKRSEIDWFPTIEKDNSFFVRQKYTRISRQVRMHAA